MFGTAIRLLARKPKPKMKPIELKMPPEQTQTITRVIFDILKEHGPLTIAGTWERVQEVGLRGLTSKRHMKIVLRWMRERQKVRLLCNHVGPNKQFLYTTWFTKVRQETDRTVNAASKPEHPPFVAGRPIVNVESTHKDV
ncbi:hypothetical protein ACJRO7_000639 [Eucalyptus globulus]|uniref:Uncharacterized protein n=1 Tax=Eucalyptus globulus TaxID=34317 RepID=A0ABD3LN98_EUCGL